VQREPFSNLHLTQHRFVIKEEYFSMDSLSCMVNVVCLMMPKAKVPKYVPPKKFQMKLKVADPMS
jgi:hypothetical protein